jgi:anti-anti-sigma regulatory factor/HAMP domain-containing protein
MSRSASVKSPNSRDKQFSLGAKISVLWHNLKISSKLSLLLITGIALPVIGITQGIVFTAQQQAKKEIQSRIAIELKILEEEIISYQELIAEETEKLATLIETSDININDPAQKSSVQSLLNRVMKTNPNESFHLITDRQGKTIAQRIYIVDKNVSQYSLLPQSDTKQEPKLRLISLPLGIDIKDIPIIDKVLRNANFGKPLMGIELLESKYLKRLGLEQQANIGIRPQKTKGLPEVKQPFPQGTYDIDQGRAGLVIMSVSPIQSTGELVGTVIIGTLINRNYEIVDQVKEKAGISTATIFAQDWRVSTNVPYKIEKNPTRAIGTRVSREVADTVLNRQLVFLGKANIIGREYLTGYSPIYDHLQQVTPNQAQPVGIAYVGEPLSEVNKNLRSLSLTGYSIGGGILVVAVLISVPLTNRWFVKPIITLNDLTKNIAAGKWEQEIFIERNDELGELAMSVSQMTNQLRELFTSLENQNKNLENELTDKITQLSEALKLSAPITRISKDIIFIPLVGIVNSERMTDLTNRCLQEINEVKAKFLIIDISGISTFDTRVAQDLISITKAVELMGCHCTISGISPAIAQTIVQLGIDLKTVKTTGKLQNAITNILLIKEK